MELVRVAELHRETRRVTHLGTPGDCERLSTRGIGRGLDDDGGRRIGREEGEGAAA